VHLLVSRSIPFIVNVIGVGCGAAAEGYYAVPQQPPRVRALQRLDRLAWYVGVSLIVLGTVWVYNANGA
jgi:hypothetical protein